MTTGSMSPQGGKMPTTDKHGIVIKISAYQAEELRVAWKQMRKLGIHTDKGKDLHDALRNELLNVILRWGDDIGYAQTGKAKPDFLKE